VRVAQRARPRTGFTPISDRVSYQPGTRADVRTLFTGYVPGDVDSGRHHVELPCHQAILVPGLPNAELVSEQVLCLRVYGELDPEEVDRVCDIIVWARSQA
jgi:dTDP-4-amino-4,6-dideoxygalactose transaminase